MKLGIAIPLKAKAISKNWQNVEQSLLKTLTSIKNQKDQNFIAVVIGHDKPSFFNDENKFTNNIYFQPFTLAKPPILTSDHDQNLELFEFDRCSKIFEGFKITVEHEITHFFPLDADDLLSNELTLYVSKNADSDAILIENGYIYYENKKVLNITNSFSSFCGSSMIASKNLIQGSSSNLNLTDFLFKKTGHVMMKKYLDDKKIKYQVPQQRLMMYVRDNGDNISRYKSHNFLYNINRTLKLIVRWRKLSKDLRKEFSFAS